jgi:tetratricopeptide (TPR) repeat protein
MNSFQVIEINNSAVAAMQQGNAKKSIELFRKAIANLKDHYLPNRLPLSFFPSSRGTPLPPQRRELPRLVSDSSIETQSDLSSSSSSLFFNAEDDDYLSAMNIDAKQDQPSLLSVPIYAKTSSYFSSKEDDAVIRLYDRAIIVCPDEQDKELLTGVALYNMALVNHCRAIERGTSDLITVALKIYEMAAAIMNDSKIQSGAADLLQLALYNNMAQIHSICFATREMFTCLDKTRTFLSAATDESLHYDDYDFFFRNTVIQIEELTLAPAA